MPRSRLDALPPEQKYQTYRGVTVKTYKLYCLIENRPNGGTHRPFFKSKQLNIWLQFIQIFKKKTGTVVDHGLSMGGRPLNR